MALTVNELKMLLGNEEPDYAAIAVKAGNDSTQAIAELAAGPDTMLASKAIYLASLIKDTRAFTIIEKASNSSVSRLRIAAASALPNLSAPNRNKLAEKLIDHEDVSIQKLTLRALDGKISAALKQKVNMLNENSGSEVIRELSNSALKKIK